jgi:threonine dehydrogenase-like Zn-dependent dehydrogenase
VLSLESARAAVLVEPQHFSQTLLPIQPMETGGWLAVEATGLSGADVQTWRGDLRGLTYPIIPGQQVVGRIASWSDDSIPFEVGTRVVVEPLIRCGTCRRCSNGLASCTRRRPANVYGLLPSTEPPGLWGGLAEYLYLDPHARLHPVSDDISAPMATFAHHLAAGRTWAVELPHLSADANLLILGPGPRGLACLFAAQEAGAGWIGVSGLDVDGDRLAMARQIGAHMTVDATREDVGSAVAHSLGSRPDIVVDATSDDPEAIHTALDVVRPGGVVVLASTKGGRTIGQFISDVIVEKQLTLVGARGASTAAYEWATKELERDSRIDQMVSHEFPVDEASRAIQAAAGLLGHEELISVAVTF